MKQVCFNQLPLKYTGAQRRYLKCSMRGTNNQLPDRFYKFVHLQLFNVRYKFVHLRFPKILPFASRRERLFIDPRQQFRILHSSGKMLTCYLRDTNKFLRCRTLCTSILKYRFPTKDIKLTRFVIFEVPGVPQL